jgi:hypothetical protein
VRFHPVRVHPVRGLLRNALAVFFLAVATAPTALANTDLARGLVPTWSKPPGYDRCTDAGDATQLTDGARAGSEYIWLDKATVGWVVQPGEVVTLVFDLGRTCSLDSVVVRSAWFARTDVVPPSIACAVGNSAERFTATAALDATTLPAPDSTRAVRVSLAVPLRSAQGRFVLVAALARQRFVFSDEIEIWGNAAAATAVTRPRTSAPAADPLGRPFTPAEAATFAAAQRRQWAVRGALPAPAAGLASRGTDEESARFAARARAWHAAGKPALTVRRIDPWAPSTPWSDLQTACTDTLEVWPGAWSAAAIEIASASTSRTHVTLGARASDGALHVTLREVVGVESRDGRWVNDALPLAPAALELRPGEVRQVWIDIEAANLQPGVQPVTITAGSQTLAIPVRRSRGEARSRSALRRRLDLPAAVRADARCASGGARRQSRPRHRHVVVRPGCRAVAAPRQHRRARPSHAAARFQRLRRPAGAA